MQTPFRFFILASVVLMSAVLPSGPDLISAATASGTESLNARIEKAREMVLKGERMSAIKTFKELAREHATSSKSLREVMHAWREVSELFLTDRGQNQASLADSYWMTRPKDAVDILLPLLKLEDGNLGVARLGARSALRAYDCAKADTFVTRAELVFPSGAEVRLLRLQVQDCLNGSNAAAPPLKLPAPMTATPTESEPNDEEPALRLLGVKDAIRRKDLKTARATLGLWEAQVSLEAGEDPEFWYGKWRVSSDTSRDRLAARKYLRLCAEMTPRRRKKFANHPELCAHTESVESDLKSSEKAE